MLVSNDGDFLPQMERLLDGRRMGLLAFSEFKNSGFTALIDRGLEFFDLEYDVQAFNEQLPRLRIIPIDEFDPKDFLCSGSLVLRTPYGNRLQVTEPTQWARRQHPGLELVRGERARRCAGR